MSVFGGDSWARDAQQRKRRLDDLLSPSTPESFRRLPNGKLACLVCPHRPVLDSPLMLSMHNKGARHIAAESRLREKELSKKHEMNKRLALSSDASHSNSANPHSSSKLTNMKEKPLIEQTRRAILEAQSSRFHDFNGKKCNSSKGESFAGNQIQGKLLSDWQTEAQKRQEQELRFTASGWKRDGHGRWYRDENVEFDSDEDDPNICLR
ncbi:sodium channel modifier 1-like isoform X2 [Panicum hallii]|uniref:sodium channel modifier 1-like isoform X2 n=1 Tax=Panicum hallii TaxID=206008 RepID=UPI000DF4D396|nr:sodium channel modifier 1-like isoform X2 [Panicum hallii]